MLSITASSLLLFLALVLPLALPSRAWAQLAMPGKVMTYRTFDIDSGEELQRMRVWDATDGGVEAEFKVATYPIGTEVLSECEFANGITRPATSYRSITRAANGELERSDFDILDPTCYPFLAQPVTADMQPESCLNRNALDLPALLNGAQATMWIWSDSGLVGVIFHRESAERLTIAHAAYDAIRIRIDTDLSKLFPRVPALFLKLIKPHFTIWVTRDPPYYVLKMVGFGSDRGSIHKNTAVELLAAEELATNDLPVPRELAETDMVGASPRLTTVNSGSFTQGNRTGHVDLATASTAEGELLVTHVAFGNGLATESRTLVDHRASPATVYLDDRSFGADGAMVRKHMLFFRPAAFPDEPNKEMPTDLYAADTTLGLVLPGLLPEGAEEAHFHVMDFSGQVNELSVRKQDVTTIALSGDDARAIHATLKPIVEVPLLLRPLAYFFIPTFDAYFEADTAHRILKFEGPLGPPGVPNATMVADEKIALPARVSTAR